MTEMGFFVLGFVTTLAIVCVAEVIMFGSGGNRHAQVGKK